MQLIDMQSLDLVGRSTSHPHPIHLNVSLTTAAARASKAFSIHQSAHGTQTQTNRQHGHKPV